MPSTTVVTLISFTRIVVLFYYLATQQLLPIQGTLSEDVVEKYLITRRGRTDSDVFKVSNKTSHKCPEDVCKNSSAWVNNSAPCSCSCKANTATFLLQLGSCGDITSVNESLFGICSRFEWPFSVESLNLADEGEVDIGPYNSYQACQVVPGWAAFYDYQLENKWARVHSEIFKMERAHGKLIFKWTNGTDKNLLGRIVRVEINCSSASTSPPPKTACLIFKSSGQITYGIGVNDSSVPESGTSTKLGSVAKTTPYTSPITKTTSVTESVDGTSKKDSGTNGIYIGSGLGIGIGVGLALALGIFIIVLVVSCMRRKSNNNQRKLEPAVGNSVVEIQMERPTDDVSIASEQDGQPTYQYLVTNNGQSNEGADLSEGYYGYCSLYRSVDKYVPVTAATVYQNVHTSETAPDYQNMQTPVTALDYQNMQILEGGLPYAPMQSLGSQTESEYEALRASDWQNVYEPLHERGNSISLKTNGP